MTTIKDIAREAGVSVSTVSRVIAGHPDVSVRTAELVRGVITKYHFTVNRNARNLKQSETTTILVVIKGRRNVLFASMLEHVQAAVMPTGFTVTTQYVDEDANEVLEAERLVPEIKPRGVVFLGGNADNVTNNALRIGEPCPAVVLTNTVAKAGKPFISSVTTDDRRSAREAARYLIDRGHRNIGVIGGDPLCSPISNQRQQGVLDALRESGIELNTATHCVETRFSLEAGYEAAESLVKTAQGITAIYAMSDMMALGAMRALYDQGLRVPDDISLIGHDGVDLVTYVIPKLVTIRQPQQQMAFRAIEILVDHIHGMSTPIEEFLEAEIVAGESVRTLVGR